MFKKILIVIIVVALLGVFGVTLYVNNIDWNMHKDKISAQFLNATGKEIEFKGSVRFSLLPSPSLEASDIQIYNKNDKNERVLLADIKKLVGSLSVKSLLLGGNFNVDRMSIVEPQIFVELYPNGKLNWQTLEGTAQSFDIENVEISLDSVTVERATMVIKSEVYDVNAVLDNLSAEVISQSLYGPYRIDGSYVKDKTLGGFAISLGQFSDSFATSVNAVLSHPQSDSYLRFDGTVLVSNDAINGNLTVESQNPVNFVNSNVRNMDISENYEYPLALSMELKTDKTQIALSNIIVKYGQSAGAGNILIPRLEPQIGESAAPRRKIDAVFNMTELELEPAVQLVKDFIAKYDGKVSYTPEVGFDLIADMKSVKTMYNNEVIRAFNLSFDYIDNILNLQNLSAMLPGEANTSISGELFSVEKKLTYNFEVKSDVNDLAKTLGWLGHPVTEVVQGTYKKSAFNGVVSGTLDTVKISPLEIVVDKTNTKAQAAIIRGDKTRWFVIANMDSLNFDSYFTAFPQDLADASYEVKLSNLFKKMSALNDLDLQFRYNLKSGVYGKVPFDNLATEAALKDGVLKFSNLTIKSIATATVDLNGELSGFGTAPAINNVNYTLDIKNVPSFLERLKLSIPSVNFQELNTLTSSGSVSGDLKNVKIDSTAKLGNVDVGYKGGIAKQGVVYNFGGKLDLRAPDFVRFVNNMSLEYNPDYQLGLFRLSGDIKGNLGAFMIKDMNAGIGANTFAGDWVYQEVEGRKLVKADLKVNRFEFEKFFYNKSKDNKETFRSNKDSATFIAKPELSLAQIDYSWLKDWDMEGRFVVDSLSLNNKSVSNASWIMALNKEVLKVAKINAGLADGTVEGSFELDVPAEARLRGQLDFKNVNVNKNIWSGTLYGLSGGKFDGVLKFDTSATSADSMMIELSGGLNFTVSSPVFKGWNLDKIAEDLKNREISDGLALMVRDMLSQGETKFETLTGEFVLSKGNFTSKDMYFEGSSYDVDVNSTGSLKGWITNTAMNAIFREAPQEINLKFSLDGGINIPALDVETGNVETVYDQYWANIAGKAKAEEEAKIKSFRALMDEQQVEAEKLQARLDGIIAVFEAQSSLARDDDMIGRYEEIGNEIDKAQTGLMNTFGKDELSDITDEVIEGIKKDNAAAPKEMDAIETAMTFVHADDVKVRVNQSYNDIFDIFNKSKTLASTYLDSYGEYDKRLAKIQTDYRIRDDKNIAAMREQIEASLLIIDEINTQIGRENVLVRPIADVVILEEYAKRFDDAHKMAFDEYAKMEATAKNVADYTNGKVTAEENAYYQGIKDAEMKKKLEENVGQISTSSGKMVKIERDYEDIQKSEEAVSSEEVKVLDFSFGGNVSGSVVSARAARRQQPKEPETGVLLKMESDAEDVSVEASGVILKQD